MELKCRLDHIGIVVRDLEEAKAYYKQCFGFDASSPIVDEPAQKVKIVFLETGHGDAPSIELIQPVSEASTVFNFLEKTGGGLHHLAYLVSDFDEAIEHFKKNKALMVGKVYPGAGHKGQRVIWFYTARKDLVELIEEKK
ncbi:MAG: VOC family protein [Candidatus Omnitrophica bacterium]|nr:VOC family protein [Candidatus Omnitrophota bacterium]